MLEHCPDERAISAVHHSKPNEQYRSPWRSVPESPPDL